MQHNVNDEFTTNRYTAWLRKPSAAMKQHIPEVMSLESLGISNPWKQEINSATIATSPNNSLASPSGVETRFGLGSGFKSRSVSSYL